MLQAKTTKKFVDDKLTLALVKNLVFHDQSKHMDTQYHFILGCFARNEIPLEFVKSHDQGANIFTKPLNYDTFYKMRA